MLHLRGMHGDDHGFTESITSADGIRWAVGHGLVFNPAVVQELPELTGRVGEFKKRPAEVARCIAKSVKSEEEQMWIAQKEKRLTVLGALSENEDLHPNVGKFLVGLPDAEKFVHISCMIRYAELKNIPVADQYDIDSPFRGVKQMYRDRIKSLLSVEAEQFATHSAKAIYFPLFGTALIEYGTAAVYEALKSIETSDPESFSAAVQRFVRTSAVLSPIIGWGDETWGPVVEAINNPAVNWVEPVDDFNLQAHSYMSVSGCYNDRAFRGGSKIALWGQERALEVFEQVSRSFSSSYKNIATRDLIVGQMSGIAPESWSLRILRDVKESDVPWLHALAVAWAPRTTQVYEYLAENGQVIGLTHVNLQEVTIPAELRAAVLRRYIKVYSEHCNMPENLLKDGDASASLKATFSDRKPNDPAVITPINAYWRLTSNEHAFQITSRDTTRSLMRFLTVAEREQLMMILLLNVLTNSGSSARTQRDVLFAAIGEGNTLTDASRESILRLVFHFQRTSGWKYDSMSPQAFCQVLHDAVNVENQDAYKIIKGICAVFDYVGAATGINNGHILMFEALLVFYIEKIHGGSGELFEAANSLLGSDYKGTHVDFVETLNTLAG